MGFKISSAIRFNLDQSKILSSGNGLIFYLDCFRTKGQGISLQGGPVCLCCAEILTFYISATNQVIN